MQIPFMIIGLTGPLGAGCSTLAAELEIQKPKEFIAKHNIEKSTTDRIEHISEQLEGVSELECPDLFRDLVGCLKERAYLRELKKINELNIMRISMSELIVKLSMRSIGSLEFRTWADIHPGVAALLLAFHEKWNGILAQFDYCINDKKYEELDCAKIDEMLQELKEVRSQIAEFEKEAYWYGEAEGLFLQNFGDSLRKTGNAFSEDDSVSLSDEIPDKENSLYIIANEANNLIKYYRNRPDRENRIHCFVMDAFRNYLEVEFFRKRYEQFVLISIYASQHTRMERFRRLLKGTDRILPDCFPIKFENADRRDSGQLGVAAHTLHSQSVSRCAYLADIAIDNDTDSECFETALYSKFLKYLALIVFPGCIQPTKEETYMNMAYSLSLRSTCISRQVGAVITDSEGSVLGQGWNDVGHEQIGCGLRVYDDFLNGRVFHSSQLAKKIDFDLINIIVEESADAICFKDIMSKQLIAKEAAKLQLVDPKDVPNKDDELAAALNEKAKKAVTEKLKIKRLEYCRSLHAEENALLQVASKGGNGVLGGTIYTTTFPCELCAKKIYQSGISKIVYTEPYPDNISELFLQDGIKIIEVRQFEGVKSSGYFKLYKPRYDRKDAQRL